MKSVPIEQVAHKAKEVALKQGYHHFTVIAIGEKGVTALDECDFPGGCLPDEYEQKMACLYAIGTMVTQGLGTLNQVFFISEGWRKPKQSPDEIEELIIVCLDIVHNTQMAMTFDYIRDKKKKLIAMKEHRPATEAKSDLLTAFVAGYNAKKRNQAA